MQKIKLYLLLLTASSTLFAKVTLYPFGAHTSYKEGFKRSATSLGIYAQSPYEEKLFKAGYEYKSVSYDNSDFDSYENDLVGAFFTPLPNSLALDVALHFTISNLDQADHNQIYFASLSYLKRENFILGLDMAYSRYNKHSLSKETLQFSPYFGFWYGDLLSRLGRLFIKFHYNYINPNQENVSLQRRYNSAEFSIKQYTKHFNNMFAYSFGKSLHLVKDKGFTVFNNNEIHTQGFILSSAYKVTPTSHIKLSYIYEKFDAYDPILSASKNDVKSRKFLLSASVKF